jgi:hypothetical protein
VGGEATAIVLVMRNLIKEGNKTQHPHDKVAWCKAGIKLTMGDGYPRAETIPLP